MLQEENLKVGTCITKIQRGAVCEGVITDIDEIGFRSYNILWYIRNDKTTNFKFYMISEEVVFQNIENCDIAPVPHFCSVSNLYCVLDKLNVELNSCSLFYTMENSEVLDLFIHLRGQNGQFIEIVVAGDMVEPYVWLNVVSNVDELSIDESMEEDDFSFAGVNTDIILLDLSDEEVRKNHAYMSKIIDFTGNEFIHTDLSGIAIYCNEGKAFMMIYDSSDKENQYQTVEISDWFDTLFYVMDGSEIKYNLLN